MLVFYLQGARLELKNLKNGSGIRNQVTNSPPDDFFEPITLEKEQKDWTAEQWAEHLKREQDAINDNFQKWKRKKDAEPKGKIVIRFDEKYFHKDTRLVIDFLKTCLKILNFASPLLARFFPVVAPILWITKGIQALELLLKLKIIKRLKMEFKELSDDFADCVVLGCRIVNGIERSYENKELEISDISNFIPAIKAVGAAIEGASEAVIPKTPVAIGECVELIKIELDLADDVAEAKAEKIISLAASLYGVFAK